MKKLTFFVILSVLLICTLLGGAFLYLYLSGHKAFEYSVAKEGKLLGSVKVDRYVTENRVIYKSVYRSGFLTEAPETEQKLTLFKHSRTPAKYLKTSVGAEGLTRNIVLVQNGEVSDYLFLEYPKFLKLNSFPTGEKTLLFAPDDIISYMSVTERYNFWKKGSQFFEIMIPVDTTVPPMRDKIEVKYIDEDYVQVAGRRIEAERFSLKAESLPDIEFTVGKYGHVPLTVEYRSEDVVIKLTRFIETPEKRIRSFFEKIMILFRDEDPHEVAASAVAGGEALKMRGPRDSGGYSTQEVFFESDNVMRKGTVYKPFGKGPFPAVVFVADDGIVSVGEEGLISALGDKLASEGIVFFRWSGPDRDNIRGKRPLADDAARIQHIRDAADYLSGMPEVGGASVYVSGYRGGGYLAVTAASGARSIKGCIVLGIADNFEKHFLSGEDSARALNEGLSREGFRRFQQGFINQCVSVMRSHFDKVLASESEQDFFLGMRLPEGAFKQYLTRHPYERMLAFDKPFLLIVGRDELFYDKASVNDLKYLIAYNNPYSKVAEFRTLGRNMGRIRDRDGYLYFAADEEVLAMISGWINGEAR